MQRVKEYEDASLDNPSDNEVRPWLEPTDRIKESFEVPDAQPAGEMANLNDANSIMRGTMSVQSDSDKRNGTRNAASRAMRSSFSDAGERTTLSGEY